MKKGIIMALCVISCAALTACSTGNASGTSAGTSAVQNSSAAENSSDIETEPELPSEEPNSALAIGETCSLGGFDITVDGFSFEDKLNSGEYLAFSPDEGNVYLVTNLTVKNTASEAQTFAPSFSVGQNSIKVNYAGAYEFSGTNLIGLKEDIHDSKLNPLSSISGVYVFSVADEVSQTTDNSLSLVFTIDGETATYTLR